MAGNTNINDIENAILTGKAQFELWKLNFEQNFFEPATEDLALQLYQSLDNVTKARFRNRNPEMANVLDQLSEGVNNGY